MSHATTVVVPGGQSRVPRDFRSIGNEAPPQPEPPDDRPPTKYPRKTQKPVLLSVGHHRRLAQWALATGRTMRSLLDDAVDLLLEREREAALRRIARRGHYADGSPATAADVTKLSP